MGPGDGGERHGAPGGTASLITYPAGDESVNVNGSVIASDGGWTAA